MKDEIGDLLTRLEEEAHLDPPPHTPAASTLAGLPPINRVARKASKRTCADWRYVANAMATLERLPAEEESIHFLLGGFFQGFDLVPAVQRLRNKPFARVWMTTLGFSDANVAGMCELLDTKLVRDLLLVISTYFKGVETAAVDDAKRALKRRGGRVVVARCHAKVTLMEFSKREQYVVETVCKFYKKESL